MIKSSNLLMHNQSSL